MDVPIKGDIIGARYRLEEVIGEGGTAIVFRAWDESAGRAVALKVIKPGPGGYDAVTLRRFDREVRIIANLTDQHTVTLYDSGRSGDYLFMVFELVGGEDLAEHLARHGRLAPHDARHVLLQVLSSLHEAHTHGLLHRDIKPDNVRIYVTHKSMRTVKLLDFGIARASEDNASITKTGELVGTPRYMSPEALMEKQLTAASDVYSVGILALEMLYGRDALHGDRWDDQYDRLIEGHVFTFDNDDVPRELRQVIDRMCAQDPADRYPSAGAALRALRELRFEDEEATTVAPEPSSRSMEAQQPPRPQEPRPQEQRPHGPRVARPHTVSEQSTPAHRPMRAVPTLPSRRYYMRKRDLVLAAVGVFSLTLIIALLLSS